MYGMLSGSHHHHHQNHHRTVHGVSMFQQQQPPLLNNSNNNSSSIFFKPCFNKAPPCSSSSLIWAESNNNNSNFEALEFSSSPANLIGSSSEPTSVLDLRSPSPNNSRALSASSSSSSDCNNRNTGNIVDASSSSHHHQQHQQAKVKSTTIHQVNHYNSNSSPGEGGGDEHELQDELQQAGVGYGVLPLFYSAQGIRPVENLESSGGDQWSLLQDVLGSHQELQQQQQNSKQKYEELESELLSSSSPACAHQENSSSTSFMRWFLEEPGVPAPEIDGLLPPWQHQQQLQQQHQMMMMVKQEEQQQQQQLQPPSSSLHPHLAHLESFTRRTLPLVSSSHDVFHQQPVQFQEQSPFSGMNMNLLWQQQQQGFQQSFQIQQQQQQQQREPFLLGMLQDDPPHQHNFGGLASSLASLPRPPPFLMENLASQQQQHHHNLPHHQHHLQVRDLKQQQRMPPRSPDMNNNSIHIKRELTGGYFEPSNKMARTSTSVSSPGHPGHPVAPPHRGGGGAGGGGNTDDANWCSSSGASFVSRLLLRAAEACESGNREHAQSILARLNDHHQHHHTQLLLQQQQQKPGGTTLIHLSPAQRIGFIFRDILSDRLSRTSSNQAGASSSSSSSSGTNPTPNPSPVAAPAEIVERVQACKSLCDDSKLLRFAHFVANQAISEALEGEESVHILDLSEAGSSPASNSYFGGQWSSFVASIIRQKTPKPIRIRITLAGTREHALCFAISSLKELAREYHSSTTTSGATISGPEFEFHGVLTRPGYPVSLSEMGVHPEEPLIVNLVLGLHKLVPASEVLRSIRACNPKLVLLVEQELEVKSSFVGRFRDGLEHHTSVAESVSCEDWTREDSERVERLVWRPEIEALLSGSLEHQRLENWRLRMAQAGFGNSKMSEMCDKLAQSLFSLDKNGSSSSSNNNNNTTSGNRGLFEILNDDGSLMLSFKGKHLASASAWKPCG